MCIRDRLRGVPGTASNKEAVYIRKLNQLLSVLGIYAAAVKNGDAASLFPAKALAQNPPDAFMARSHLITVRGDAVHADGPYRFVGNPEIIRLFSGDGMKSHL